MRKINTTTSWKTEMLGALLMSVGRKAVDSKLARLLPGLEDLPHLLDVEKRASRRENQTGNNSIKRKGEDAE